MNYAMLDKVKKREALINLPRAVLAACVKSQVALLERLHGHGELR